MTACLEKACFCLKTEIILKCLNCIIMEMILSFISRHCLLVVIVCAVALIISKYIELFRDDSIFIRWIRNIFWPSVAAFAIVTYLDVQAFWLFALLAVGINGLTSWLVDSLLFFFWDYNVNDYPEDDDIDPENDDFEK